MQLAAQVTSDLFFLFLQLIRSASKIETGKQGELRSERDGSAG
jgi:hypothetical protein